MKVGRIGRAIALYRMMAKSKKGKRGLASKAVGHKDPNAGLKMALEDYGFSSEDDFRSMQWIMMRESGGRPGAVNSESGATGLFQLMPGNFGYMPRGAKSVGNAYEEALGGINYMRQRYGSPQKAISFWRRNSWW